jgi:FtsP/CotA-like multicopper oxidase with cupredoxin domain
MKRRTFLRGTAALGSVAFAGPMFPLQTAAPTDKTLTRVKRTTRFGKNGIMIPDEGS